MNHAPLVEVWRGDFLECQHFGHAVISTARGEIVEAWGDPHHVILPRSASKMIQAVPMVETGAADALGLTERHLAISCASHQGAAIHTTLVRQWLKDLDLTEADLRCGSHPPTDTETRHELVRAGTEADQTHNNCSGKHTGFLAFGKVLGSGPEYVDPDHPVQRHIKDVFEELTDAKSPGYGIDGCSAPNFATTVYGLARAVAQFADPPNSTRGRSMVRLRDAMATFPELVAGEGRACTELMRAMDGRVALKTGAEGVFTAIIPEKKLGIALKIEDGAARAAECAIASLLVRLGVLAADHPAALKRRNVVMKNCRDFSVGYIHPAAALL